MTTPHPIHLLGPLFTTDDMREIFSDHRRLQAMLNFEAALARALASAGVVSKEAAAAIESQCDANLFSIEKLARESALAGNVAIPMAKQLTSLVAKNDEKASAFVHYGATSQDAIDTGLVLQLREAFWRSQRFARRAKRQDLDRLSFLHTHDPDYPVWWTSYPNDAPMLVAWSGGPRGQELSTLQEEEIAERAVGSLARQFGVSRREARGLVTATWHHNWETDPFARGAYSYIVVGGNGSPAKLARPIKRTLFFAGEASDPEGRTGTVHGAIATGRRAAKQLLRVL